MSWVSNCCGACSGCASSSLQIQTLAATGELPGPAHLYTGQEAVAAGVCAALRDDDYVSSTHRGHGHVVAKGSDLAGCMAELLARDTGVCRGKGGSMHMADMSLGIIGANGIVAAGIPIAVGAALSSQLRGSDQVAVAFFGEGATNEGAFHESMNLASAWTLPVIFVCENNGYGQMTRMEKVTATTEMFRRAEAYKVPEPARGRQRLLCGQRRRGRCDFATRGAAKGRLSSRQ